MNLNRFEDIFASSPFAAEKPLVPLAILDGTRDAQNLMLYHFKSFSPYPE